MASFRARVLGEPLLERFHQIRIRLCHGITGPASIKLPAPLPGYPFAMGSAVYRPENWAIFYGVHRPQLHTGFRRGAGLLHRPDILIRQGQLVPGPLADQQVLFDFI
jgi:hypothetical protein